MLEGLRGRAGEKSQCETRVSGLPLAARAHTLTAATLLVKALAQAPFVMVYDALLDRFCSRAWPGSATSIDQNTASPTKNHPFRRPRSSCCVTKDHCAAVVALPAASGHDFGCSLVSREPVQ